MAPSSFPRSGASTQPRAIQMVVRVSLAFPLVTVQLCGAWPWRVVATAAFLGSWLVLPRSSAGMATGRSELPGHRAAGVGLVTAVGAGEDAVAEVPTHGSVVLADASDRGA